MKRTFDPWVGREYWLEGFKGLRVLVLGESHYGESGTEARDDTKKIVVEWGQDKRHRFFTGAQKLVAGIPSGIWISDADRRAFWASVAFCNYVQSFAGSESRVRPTAEQWEAAREPFIETLGELKPHLVIVLGNELSYNLPELPGDIEVCVVQHPSSSVTYSKYKPMVDRAFESAVS